MPKKIDPVPISVERTRRTLRYELIMDSSGELVEVIAHRWLYTTITTNGNAQASTPDYRGSIRIAAAGLPQAFKNRIGDIEALVDTQDL